jgi:hypothetical protein
MQNPSILKQMLQSSNAGFPGSYCRSKNTILKPTSKNSTYTKFYIAKTTEEEEGEETEEKKKHKEKEESHQQ